MTSTVWLLLLSIRKWWETAYWSEMPAAVPVFQYLMSLSSCYLFF